jgi:hypothetical protein
MVLVVVLVVISERAGSRCNRSTFNGYGGGSKTRRGKTSADFETHIYSELFSSPVTGTSSSLYPVIIGLGGFLSLLFCYHHH